MTQLLQCVVDNVSAPCKDNVVEQPFSFCVNTMNTDPYLGRLVTGKVRGRFRREGFRRAESLGKRWGLPLASLEAASEQQQANFKKSINSGSHWIARFLFVSPCEHACVFIK
jgi:hypothetical protein